MKVERRAFGFTLIELSIVLVIIGLIVGSVLVGKDLIKAAQNQAQISQIEKLTTAIHTFTLKYNGPPGDLANAAVFGLGTTGGPGVNGNGDTMLAYTSATSPGYAGGIGISASQPRSRESLDFWYNLAAAGLWPNSSAAGTAFTGYTGQTDMSTAGVSETAFPKSEFTNSILIPTYMSWIAYDDPRYSAFQNGSGYISIPQPILRVLFQVLLPSQLTPKLMMDYLILEISE